MLTQAGQQVFQLRTLVVKTKCTAQVMQQIQRLFYRATKESRVRILSLRGHQIFLDGCRVTKLQQLQKALQSCEAAEGSFFGDSSNSNQLQLFPALNDVSKATKQWTVDVLPHRMLSIRVFLKKSHLLLWSAWP